MDEKITYIFKKIISNEDLTQKLLICDSLDEIYDLFVSVKGGYSKLELLKYLQEISEIQDYCMRENINEDDLENISGGLINKKFSKTISSLLVALSIGTSIGVGNNNSKDGKIIPSFGSNVSARWFGQNQQIVVQPPWLNEPIIEKIKTEYAAFYNSLPERVRNDDTVRDIMPAGRIARLAVGNENLWREYVTNAPTIIREDNMMGATMHDVSEPRAKVLEEYYNICCHDNPRVNPIDIRLDPNFQLYADSFGDFKNEGMLYQAAFAFGGNTNTVKGWEKINQLISNKEYAVLQLKMSKMVSPITGHPLMALTAGASLFFNPITNAIKSTANMVQRTFCSVYNKLIYNRLKIESDPEKMLEYLNEGLMGSIIGQEEAIRSMSVHVVGWLSARREPKMSKNVGSCLMCFLGASGIGKTLTARILSQIVFGRDMQPWQFITASAIRSDSDMIPADQIFHEDSEIVRQLMLNPEIIIVLDEVDKMSVNDPKGTVLERLRDAKDTGKLCIKTRDGNYKFIDVSKTMFIVTSNERRECWGLPEVQLSDAHARSRTVVNRDPSLTNRFTVIEFKDLEADSYKILLSPLIEEFVDSCEKNHHSKVVLSDDFVDELSRACVLKNKGARGANDYIIAMNGSIIEYKKKMSGLPEQVLLKFDLTNENFIFESA